MNNQTSAPQLPALDPSQGTPVLCEKCGGEYFEAKEQFKLLKYSRLITGAPVDQYGGVLKQIYTCAKCGETLEFPKD